MLFEAPGRVAATLRDLAAACGAGPARRRLPRADQAPRADRPRDARRAGGRGRATGAIPARGEFVLVVGGRGRGGRAGAADDGRGARARGGRGAEVERSGRGRRRPRRGRPPGRGRDRHSRDAASTAPTRARLGIGRDDRRDRPRRRPLRPPDPRPAVAVRAGSSLLVTRRWSASLAIVLDFGLHADETVLFVVSAAAILGLAWVVGLSTERLGSLTGPQVGGILNATFGNIAELIIAFFALQAGLIEVVKASLTGSIIGNLLLVLGASVLSAACATAPRRSAPADRRLERRAARLAADRAVRPGRLRAHDARPTARRR